MTAPCEEWYWLNTTWACGAVKVRDGIVVGGAPIFRHFRHQPLWRLRKVYQVEPVWTTESGGGEA